MHNISHWWLSVTTRHSYTPLYGLGIQKYPVEQYISVWRLSNWLFGFCGYLVWKWEDVCSGNIEWKLARGCRAILLFKNVTAFSFVPPTCFMILYPRTTTGDLVDALIPTNSGISNMGGPAGNKIPNDGGVNAALNLLSYWTTQSHNWKSHAHSCAHDNFSEDTRMWRHLNMSLCVQVLTSMIIVIWHIEAGPHHLRQCCSVLLVFKGRNTQTHAHTTHCGRLLLLVSSCLFQVPWQLIFHLQHFTHNRKWLAVFMILKSNSAMCRAFPSVLLKHQTAVILHFSRPDCLLLLARPSQSESVCIPVSWLDLRTLPFD